MVIFTPATAPPCESVTVPAIRPKMLCAAAVLTMQVVNKTANRNAAVFNENPGKSTPLTTWFDLDSFVLTRTPPSKKIEITSPAYSFWPTAFFFPPRFRTAATGKSWKGPDLAPRVLHWETASH